MNSSIFSLGGVSVDTGDKICPVCKRPNEAQVLECAYCGAPLEGGKMDPTTEKMMNVTLPLSGLDASSESDRLSSAIPTGSIAIYIRGETKPIAVTAQGEFILGRHVTEGIDNVIDLTPYGGLEKGVSRKHAIIRKIDIGYEIVDLYSTNGTWVNEKRLLPNKAYVLDSGIHIRLGQLLLVTIFGRINGS